MNLQDFDIQGYIAFMRLRDGSESTVAKNLKYFRQLIKHLNEFSYTEIKTFLDQKKLEGSAGGTLNLYVTSARIYAQFAALDPNICTFPWYPRRQKNFRKAFPDDQVIALCTAPRREGQSLQLYRLYTVFWTITGYTALRPNEAAHLTKEDILFATHQIRVRGEIAKTRKEATVPMYPHVEVLLQEYLKTVDGEYLFPKQREGRNISHGVSVIDWKNWGNDFKARLSQCDIERSPSLTAYSFRHSCGTRWAENGVDLFKLKELMRHSRLEQTLVYLHLSSAGLRKEVIAKDPLVRSQDPLLVLDHFEEEYRNSGIKNNENFSEEFKEKLNTLFFEESQKLRKK